MMSGLNVGKWRPFINRWISIQVKKKGRVYKYIIYICIKALFLVFYQTTTGSNSTKWWVELHPTHPANHTLGVRRTHTHTYKLWVKRTVSYLKWTDYIMFMVSSWKLHQLCGVTCCCVGGTLKHHCPTTPHWWWVTHCHSWNYPLGTGICCLLGREGILENHLWLCGHSKDLHCYPSSQMKLLDCGQIPDLK